MRSYRSSFLLLLLASAAPSTAFAQSSPSCGLAKTIAECFHSFEPAAAKAAVVRAATNEEKEALVALPTGADTGGTSLASNRKNLLPFLALTGLFNEGADLDDSGTLVLDLNFLLPGLGQGKNAQLQGVANTQPKVSGALRDALPEEGRDEVLGEIGNEIGDTDDTALRFTYSPANQGLGRSFQPHVKAFQALSSLAIGDIITAEAVAEIGIELAELLAPYESELSDDVEATPFEELPDALQQPLMQLVELRGREIARLEGLASAALDAADLDRFHKLVDNQPQFQLTAERKFRSSLVGPEEVGIKVAYEWGEISLNSLRKSIGDDCLDPDRATLPCLASYSAYMAQHAGDIDQGDRFSFSAEYVELDDDLIDPGLDGFDPLAIESATKLIVSTGWSRRFEVGRSGEPILLDLVGSYEDVSDDPMRQDRGVITLTITRNFAGVPVPLGIVYANHGEFLGDVDERLSAHVGLKFNAFGTKKK